MNYKFTMYGIAVTNCDHQGIAVVNCDHQGASGMEKSLLGFK